MLNPAQAVTTTQPTWYEAVAAFKRELIEHALACTGGNRTHAARILGLQRTYLLRLMRESGVKAPAPRAGARRSTGNPIRRPQSRADRSTDARPC
jgi:DNA-binding NtrC family response regulator